MKKLAAVLLLILGVWATVATYRSYRARNSAQLDQHRSAVEDREIESKHRAVAEQEALRLRELQAQQEAEEAERAIAELRAQQAAADAANSAREAQAVRWQIELDRLRREKAAAEGEAKQLAEQRQEEIKKLITAESEAMAQIRSIEFERETSRDRDAARAAAIARQMEIEKRAQERVARIRAKRAP